MVIATFGPTTAWVGKTITYDAGLFVLEGHGPITAADVLEYDRQGHLFWAYSGLREWVTQVAVPPAAPAPPTTTAAQPVLAAATAVTAAGPAPAAAAGPTGPGSAGAPAGPAASAPAAGSSWLWPVLGVVVLLVIFLAALALAGWRLRDGAGIALTFAGVAFVVLLVWSLVKPGSLLRALPGISGRALPAVLGVLCLVSFALAGVLWWMPHYELIVPADSRVVLDSTPTMNVQVVNRGLFPGTFSSAFAIGGVKQSDVTVHLSPGQSESVLLTLPAGTARGPQTLSLGGAQITAMALRPAEFKVGALQVSPTIVKIGQSISVKADVHNVGDVTGTFPGSMKANGEEAAAHPTPIGPNETRTVTYTIHGNSAGRYLLELGEAQRPVLVVKAVRLPSGTIIRRSLSGGRAHLTIKNPNSLDAEVILARASSSHSPVLGVYVRKGSTAVVNGIPDGRYMVWNSIGSDWNWTTKDFLVTQEYKRWNQPLVYDTTASTRHWTTTSSDAYWIYTQRHSQTTTHWQNWTLTLGSGPSRYTTIVTEASFPHL